MKKLICILTVLCLLLTATVFVSAAEPKATASASSTSVLVGQTVTVTFKFTADKAIGAAEPWVTYDSSVFSYEGTESGGAVNTSTAGTVKMSYFASDGVGATTYNVKIKFKALKVGEGTFAVSFPQLGLYTAENEYLGSPTARIAVSVKIENKSNNANLKWLTVPKGCTLVPAFSKNVTEYTCTVPGSVTSFPMDWETEDSKATHKVSGDLKLKVGENTRSITVTAEDGTKKVYTVKITRLQPEATPTPTLTPKPTPTLAPTATPAPLTVLVDGDEYDLIKEITLQLPEGYVTQNYKYNSNDIQIAVLGEVKLVQLDDGTKESLFVYNEKNNSFKFYKSIASLNNQLTVLYEKPEIVKDDAKDIHKVIGEGEYTVWESELFGEGYYVINVMNKLGETYPAIYCEADGSIQKISEKLIGINTSGGNVVVSTPAPDEDNGIKIDWMLVAFISGGAVLLVLIIVIIVLLSKGAKNKEKPERDWGFSSDPYDIDIESDTVENQPVKKMKKIDNDDDDFA